MSISFLSFHVHINEILCNNALHNETQYYNIKCYDGGEDVGKNESMAWNIWKGFYNIGPVTTF
jgi:hypothetical protein